MVSRMTSSGYKGRGYPGSIPSGVLKKEKKHTSYICIIYLICNIYCLYLICILYILYVIYIVYILYAYYISYILHINVESKVSGI